MQSKIQILHLYVYKAGMRFSAHVSKTAFTLIDLSNLIADLNHGFYVDRTRFWRFDQSFDPNSANHKWAFR